MNNSLPGITVKTLEYKTPEGALMESYIVYPNSDEKRPGIIIVPDWMGVGQFAKDKAEYLAALGYVTIVADIYGKDSRPQNTEEAGRLTTKYRTNRNLLRSHINAAYDALLSMPQTDEEKIVVMGYCFGGTVALELARSGANLVGAVTFHGGLATPDPRDARNIKGELLILHGDQDPMVPPSEVAAFKKEMTDANVNMKFISYEGAVHGFTNPSARDYNNKGISYNKDADKKSWDEFEKFLRKVAPIKK